MSAGAAEQNNFVSIFLLEYPVETKSKQNNLIFLLQERNVRVSK